MASHGMTGFSSVSASAAVSAAIAEASADYGKEAKSIHIFVVSVLEVGEGWQAIVQVFVEPNLELEKKLDENKEDHEQHLEQKRQGEKLEEDGGHPSLHLEAGAEHAPAPLEHIAEHHEVSALESIVHVHFPMPYEEEYHAFKSSEPKPELETYVHLLSVDEDFKNPEFIKNYLLDNDFYEATHTTELERRHERDSRQFQDNMKSQAPNLKIGGLETYEYES